MKKLLFVLLLALTSSGVYAQVKANQPSETKYANGDSYGFYIEPVADAVSYTWSVEGSSGATIWPAWDTAVDLIFSSAGYCILKCTVAKSTGPDEEFTLYVDVYDPEE